MILQIFAQLGDLTLNETTVFWRLVLGQFAEAVAPTH